MSAPAHIYRVTAQIPVAAADALATALEPHLDSIAWTWPEGGTLAQVTGFAAGPPDEGALAIASAAAAAALGVAPPDVEVAAIAVRDWVLDNRKDFPPIVAGRFFIHGRDFRETPPPGLIPLRVPQGVAFGTGDHATTRGCLMALSQLRGRPWRSVLDLGCGTAILAMGAARLCPAAGMIVASDVDARAIGVAAENLRANRLHHRVRLAVARGYAASAMRGRHFDLILANILARPLIRMAPALDRHLAPGGVAVLSGLLATDANRVMSAHMAQGLALFHRIELDGWTTLVMAKRGGRV